MLLLEGFVGIGSLLLLSPSVDCEINLDLEMESILFFYLLFDPVCYKKVSVSDKGCYFENGIIVGVFLYGQFHLEVVLWELLLHFT